MPSDVTEHRECYLILLGQRQKYYCSYIRKVKFRRTFKGLFSLLCTETLTHQGSSVGSQQTRHTLQVKHMALSSPDEAGYKFMKKTEKVNQY